MNASKKIFRGAFTGGIILLLLPAFNAYCQWNSDPMVNTPVCTTPVTQQFLPQLTPDQSGGAFITWMEASADFNSASIYAQHLSSTGMRLWAAAGVEVSGGSGTFINPQIVTDGNGGAIISWVNTTGGIIRHYIQKISSTGQVQWNPSGVQVCAVTVSQVLFYELISDGQGGAIIIWDDQRSSGLNQIYAQHVDMNGSLLWPADGLVCSPPGTNMSSHDAVADFTGGMMLCWTLTTGLVSRNDIFVQHFTVDGIAQWGASGKNICSAAKDQLYCKIIKDSNDNAIVIWQDFRLDPVMSQIYGQRIGPDGSLKWQPEGILLADSVVPASTVAKITAGTSGGAIISWLDDFVAGQSTAAHLFAIRIDSTGSPVWAKKEIASWQDLQLPADYELAADFKGGCFLSWANAANLNPSSIYDVYDLYAQHVWPDGFLEWPVSGQVISSAPMNQYYQQLVCDSTGTALLAWSDLRNGADYDLYAARLSASVPLPVTWLDFSGAIREQSVLLKWETTQEADNKGFTIQRSADGIGFDSIGFVPASLSAEPSSHYTFTDWYPHPGANYYRLQQTDIDGEKAYSRIISLDFVTENTWSIYPVPALEKITIKGISGKSIIEIYGADGKKVKVAQGSGMSVEIDISDIPSGIYYLRITGTDGGTGKSGRFIKQR